LDVYHFGIEAKGKFLKIFIIGAGIAFRVKITISLQKHERMLAKNYITLRTFI
jgi:hypothetical protein